MNAFESEYSFLAPTWKLPSVGTTSLYPNYSYNISHIPSGTQLNNPTDTFTWNNTTYNSRYLPSNSNRLNHTSTTHQQQQQQPSLLPPVKHSIQVLPSYPTIPQNYQHQNNENFNVNHDFPTNTTYEQEEYDTSTQPHHNGYSNQHNGNHVVNYPPPPPPPPPPIQKRVQIIDHNRHTPSTDYMSGRESHNSSPNENYAKELNHSQSKLKPHRNQVDDNRSDSTAASPPRQNHFNIHEYLYGLSAPDPGSYVNAYKNQRRRLQDEKGKHKTVLTQYKTFLQNGGLGPTFGNADHRTYEDKLQTEQKRKEYSKFVHATNQYKIEEQKRAQNNGGQQRSPGYTAPKHQPTKHSDPTRSHFVSADEVRDFERKIKREHDANCKCSLHAKKNHSST